MGRAAARSRRASGARAHGLGRAAVISCQRDEDVPTVRAAEFLAAAVAARVVARGPPRLFHLGRGLVARPQQYLRAVRARGARVPAAPSANDAGVASVRVCVGVSSSRKCSRAARIPPTAALPSRLRPAGRSEAHQHQLPVGSVVPPRRRRHHFSRCGAIPVSRRNAARPGPLASNAPSASRPSASPPVPAGRELAQAHPVHPADPLGLRHGHLRGGACRVPVRPDRCGLAGGYCHGEIGQSSCSKWRSASSSYSMVRSSAASANPSGASPRA